LHTAAHKTIRVFSVTIDNALLLAVLLLLTVGCYALWDSNQVTLAADSKQYAIYKPTEENEGLSFAELRAMNPEVFAWLTVFGTNIDYPVTQSTDNMKYVNTNAEGKYSLSGAIFLDSGSSPDFSDFSSILYGHHMEKKTMFGEVGLFSDEAYFDAREYGSLYFDGKEHGLEFFAFLHVDAYDGGIFRTAITDRDAQEAYLSTLLTSAMHTRDLGVTVDDRIVLLSTCSSSTTNGRDILVGRLTDDRYADPFAKAPTAPSNTATPSTDNLPELWAGAPIWAKVAAIALPLLLIALIIAAIVRRKHRKK
jgi:sortase B